MLVCDDRYFREPAVHHGYMERWSPGEASLLHQLLHSVWCQHNSQMNDILSGDERLLQQMLSLMFSLPAPSHRDRKHQQCAPQDNH